MEFPTTSILNANFQAVESFIRNFIDSQKIPNALLLLYYKGKVVFLEKFGWLDKQNNIPIQFDSIFRLYSMTKPITSVALLTLYEEKQFTLTDPISKFLPEFENMEVFVREENGNLITEKAKRPITILDLFTHTSGLSYGFYPTIDPVDKLYQKETNHEILKNKYLRDVIPIIAKMPLRFQPGEFFHYSYATDVLARLIEVFSNQPLDKFIKERIFEPLEMNDTSHHIPPEKWKRFSKVYVNTPVNQMMETSNPEFFDRYQESYRLLGGGTGLTSTIKDYFNFTLMLLNGGKFKEKRILEPRTIDLMATNHLPHNRTILEQALMKEQWEGRLPGYGMGLSVRVLIDKNEKQMGIGTHGWSGLANTVYWVDPKKQVIGIFMSQIINSAIQTLIDHNQIWRLSYEGLIK